MNTHDSDEPDNLPEEPIDSDEPIDLGEAVAENEPVVEQPAEEEEPVETDEPVDEEEAIEDEDQVDRTIPAKVTLTTIILCLLNIVAACAFLFLLMLDYQKRQSWSYAVFLHDLYLMGLPLREESTTFTASRELRAAFVLSGDSLREEFMARRTGGKGGEFQSIKEVFKVRITPEQLHPGVLSKAFEGLGPPVRTLQEELKRVEDNLFTDIATTAKEMSELAKTEAQKRKLLGQVLLPLAWNGSQIEAADRRIKAAKTADLDGLLQEAIQRRILCNILLPLDVWRPLEQKDKRLHDAVETDKVKLDELKEMVSFRFKEADADKMWDGRGRESYEKRRAIAYLLLVVSLVKKPDNQPLYPKGPERVEVVVGLEEYNRAMDTLTMATQVLRQNLYTKITKDREGFSFFDGGRLAKQGGFVEHHRQSIQRILDLIATIKREETRLLELKDLEQMNRKQYEERKKHYDEVLRQVIDARTETARATAELQRLQQQLFAAQLELAEAAETNQRLEAEIRQLEMSRLSRSQR